MANASAGSPPRPGSWKADHALAQRRWRGPVAKYDLITEGLIALGVVGLLLILLTTFLGSPRIAAVSFKSWATHDPLDFTQTTLSELNGTSETATYGPPYNQGTGQLQSLGPISFQALGGITLPVDAPNDLVVRPLEAFAPLNPSLEQALQTWKQASNEQRATWGANSGKANLKLDGGRVALEGGDVGPVPIMLTAMLAMARSGALDATLVNAPGQFYSMDNTKALLFLEDGQYLGKIARKYTLTGERWGVTNELGSWPGQPWLWAYSFFYQVPPWKTIGTDIIVIATVTPLFLILLFLPFIPGLRSLPRHLGVYRVVWRDYYKTYGRTIRDAPF